MTARRTVVLESDGLRLKGAVLAVDRAGGVALHAVAACDDADPARALRSVLANLGAGRGLPSACVLVTAEAATALVRLPLPAGRPRAPQEMAQLVRWELEPYAAQQMAVRPLGAILVGRGHLRPEQVAQVTTALQERRRTAGREGAPPRFGTLAKELGLITEDQLQEALQLQSRAATAGEDYACGWSPQPAESGATAEGSLWLVAGMPRARRRWWIDELNRHGLKLLGIYPLVGPAAAACHGPGSSRAILETEWDYVACLEMRGDGVHSLQVLPLGEEEPAARVCQELLDAVRAEQVLLVGRNGDAASLSGTLRSRDGSAPAPLVPPLEGALPEQVRPGSLARMAGAARHALGRAPATTSVRIPVRDAGPPLRQRPVAWWLATAGAVALVLLALELWLSSALGRARSDLDDVRQPLQEVEREVGARRALAAEVKRLREAIEAERARGAERAALIRVFREDLDRRTRLLPGLLETLAQSASDEIVLNRLSEERPGELLVEGWALTERAAQGFTGSVTRGVGALGLCADRQEIRCADGRSGARGYSFRFFLVPAPAGEEAACAD